MKKFVGIVLTFILISCASGDESTAKPDAKNIIIMISDGMGFNHKLAADYYQYGKAGEQIYEEFDIQLAMSTYPGTTSSTPGAPLDCGYDADAAWKEFRYVTDKETDSAAAATAMATGVKTYNNSIGMDNDGKPLKNIMQAAEEVGKSTGVVTTVPWSHATPAGFIAHNLSRNNYEAIAIEMLGSDAEVIMGGGNPLYDNDGKPTASPSNYQLVGGESLWKSLVAGTAGGNKSWKLIQTRKEFHALAEGSTPERVCGTFQAYQTTQQRRSGSASAAPYAVPLNDNVPTLAEMAKAALNVLDNDPDGFCLMIEGGAVDWASHSNQSGRVIEEQIDFNKAVEAVVEWIEKDSSWSETLLIVTADHETGYLTGPASDPEWKSITNNGAGVLPGMEWHSGSHTNSLVPFTAHGVGCELFKEYCKCRDAVRGDYIDNTDIAKVVLELLN